MSQYKIATNPLTVIVGWDNPLQTHFAQVIDQSKPEEEEMICPFGATEELTTVKSLIGAISPYAVIPEDIARKLETDKAESLPPTQFQLLLCEKFTTNRNADVIAKFGTIVGDQQTFTPNGSMGE